MEITRHGSQRYRGTTRVLPNLILKTGQEDKWKDNVRWDTDTKQIVVKARWVPHDDGRTQHDYFIRLSLDDVTSLIALLGHVGSADDASLLRDHLNTQIPSLVKLLACASGLLPTPIEDPVV